MRTVRTILQDRDATDGARDLAVEVPFWISIVLFYALIIAAIIKYVVMR